MYRSSELLLVRNESRLVPRRLCGLMWWQLLGLTLTLALFSTSATAKGWLGAPPDCWKEPRNYHQKSDTSKWRDRVELELVENPADKIEGANLSPNNGYFFSLSGERPVFKLLIESEQEDALRITFSETNGINDVRWINENLIFVRAWWGRIAATDFIIDTEQQKIIHHQAVTDGHLFFNQFKGACLNHGCTCMEKQAGA